MLYNINNLKIIEAKLVIGFANVISETTTEKFIRKILDLFKNTK